MTCLRLFFFCGPCLVSALLAGGSLRLACFLAASSSSPAGISGICFAHCSSHSSAGLRTPGFHDSAPELIGLSDLGISRISGAVRAWNTAVCAVPECGNMVRDSQALNTHFMLLGFLAAPNRACGVEGLRVVRCSGFRKFLSCNERFRFRDTVWA